jgi:hypothetical protein
MANTVCTKVLGPASLSSIMSEAEKDAEISSLKNLYEEEKQIVARIWEFLGSPSFEELKGRTLYDIIRKKEEELQRLQTRCALLEQLLSECVRHHYYDENACSPSWLEEAKKATSG